ncbi:hypothetical protein Tco_0690367 [Tanacetum coccineum]
MLAIQAKEVMVQGIPLTSTTTSILSTILMKTNPNVVFITHQKTQTPRQPLNQDTELPQTSVHIPNVPDESVYEEWDDRVERATTTAASLDAAQASGSINKTQPTTIPNVPHSHEIGTGSSPRCQEAIRGSIAQTRKIDEIDQDPDITLVQHDAEIQGRHGQEMEFETKVYTAEDVSTAGVAVTTAGASISTASPPTVSTAEDISTAETLVYIRRSAAKDKGKAKMDESEPEKTKTQVWVILL